jgi:hypothetical protein
MQQKGRPLVANPPVVKSVEPIQEVKKLDAPKKLESPFLNQQNTEAPKLVEPPKKIANNPFEQLKKPEPEKLAP